MKRYDFSTDIVERFFHALSCLGRNEISFDCVNYVVLRLCLKTPFLKLLFDLVHELLTSNLIEFVDLVDQY